MTAVQAVRPAATFPLSHLKTAHVANAPKSFWQSGDKPTAAKAPYCVSISGPEMAQRFRQACAFIIQMAAQGRRIAVR